MELSPFRRGLFQTGSVRDDLLEQAGYFENNQHRMNYLELREEGWLIGSGMVESGAKQFKDRFTGPGMRWSRPGAERLLPIRAAVMSRTFDDGAEHRQRSHRHVRHHH